MNNITLDPITKKFTQIIPEAKVCHICSGNSFVDDHHYDCQEGKISPETVPLCRRCHRTYHDNGVGWFEDEYLDKALEIENKRRQIIYASLKNPVEPLILLKREDVKRTDYFNKTHGLKETKETKGSQTPIFPFHLPRGEPLCGWDWVNEHLYDLMDYVPRIEVTGPNVNLAVDINSKKDMREVTKTLRGLRNNNHNKEKVVVLDPITKVFTEV